MSPVATAARRVAGVVSPRHRRYQRLLGSCVLDPTQLPRPLTAPHANDVIICGCPRSGTALLTAALHQPPTMVTVMEPWDGLRLTPAELFGSLRSELATGALVRGRLDLDALAAAGTVSWTEEGRHAFPVEIDDDTLLGVKWPTYWQYLPLLDSTRFVACVRDPADVLASFVDQPGRLSHGLEYDVAFNRHLNDQLAEIPSVEERRIALYDTVNQVVLDHADRPNVHLVHYERWADEPDRVMDDLSDFLDRDLRHSRVRLRPRSRADDTTRRAIRDRSSTARALGY